ncbi:MAG: AAA family ATPase [Armatimonadota bacterium]
MAIALATRDFKNEKEITGTVVRTFFASDRFTAGRIQAVNGPITDKDISFNIQGKVPEGKLITLRGGWIKDPKYGWQFKAKSFDYPMPSATSGAAGLEHYLATDPDFYGIGPAKARLIAAAFETNFDTVIREDPARVAEVGKITLEQAEQIRKVWIERSSINAVSTWLAEFGLTANQIKRIADQYGNRAQEILTENPYKLMDELDGFGFLRTDAIALKMGVAKDHPGRIRACLLYILDEESNNAGHTYVELKRLVKAALANLYLDTLQAKKLITDIALQLCEADDSPIMLVESDGVEYIALRWLYHQEIALLKWFKLYGPLRGIPQSGDQTDMQYEADIDQLVHTYTSEQKLKLEDAQTTAVEVALKRKISVITGGAGTGKSFTIKTIKSIYQQADCDVAVCAPTGKAARRLANDSIPASTIHRLLDYCPAEGGFTYNENKKLPYKVVIVDEVSMCAIPLLYSLFSAIDLTTTTVVLVGDPNQLPPIGAGNVLRDVVAHDILPVTHLTVCHRNAGKLKENCADILSGRLNRKKSKKRPTDAAFEWFVVDDREDSEEVVNLIKLLMREQFDAWHFDPITECQVIVPQHKGPLGVNRLNLEMQRIWQAKRYQRELPPIDNFDRRPQLLPGDKIMQIKNDYRLDEMHGGVMNGTQGIIKDILDPPGDKRFYVIQFEDRTYTVEVEVGSEQADHIVLAYACTCHKVQGSQYDCVVSIVHRTHAFMLSRNLLYTAATRARTSSIIIGEPVGIRRACHTITPMQRNTWMSLLAGGTCSGQDSTENN